jgi:DNA-binding GntR family transcriptional regulator
MAILAQIENKVSLEQRAYEEIRAAIITNRLKPEQLLPEEQLANDLGISRTPVRGALRRLENEQLVKCNNSKTMEVASLSQSDTEGLALVRRALEPLVCRMLAETITDCQFRFLSDLLQRQQAAAENSMFEKYISLEYEWNTKLAEFTGNQWLLASIKQIEVFTCRTLMLSENLQMHGITAVEEHRAILNAVHAHNADEAEMLMKNHIQSVYDRID